MDIFTRILSSSNNGGENTTKTYDAIQSLQQQHGLSATFTDLLFDAYSTDYSHVTLTVDDIGNLLKDLDIKSSKFNFKRKSVAEYRSTNFKVNDLVKFWKLQCIDLTKKGLSKTDFHLICPSLLYFIDCQRDLSHSRTNIASKKEIWIYSVISIAFIFGLLAILKIFVLFFAEAYIVTSQLTKSYLLAVTIGTLCGDAFLHLIPYTMLKGTNIAIHLELTNTEERAQNYSQLWRGLFCLVGVYAFFVVELIVKSKTGHGHSHRGNERGNSNPQIHTEKGYKHLLEDESVYDSDDDTIELDLGLTSSINPEKSEHKRLETTDFGEINDSIEIGEDQKHTTNTNDHENNETTNFLEIDKNEKLLPKPVKNNADSCHACLQISYVEGFCWLTYGITVGATFTASISCGISTSIVLLLYELTQIIHICGDAPSLNEKKCVFIANSMLSGTILMIIAFIGILIGILLSVWYTIMHHFILSIIAGIFLYLSLSVLLLKLADILTNKNSSKWMTLVIQQLGILSGTFVIIVIYICI